MAYINKGLHYFKYGNGKKFMFLKFVGTGTPTDPSLPAYESSILSIKAVVSNSIRFYNMGTFSIDDTNISFVIQSNGLTYQIKDGNTNIVQWGTTFGNDWGVWFPLVFVDETNLQIHFGYISKTQKAVIPGFTYTAPETGTAGYAIWDQIPSSRVFTGGTAISNTNIYNLFSGTKPLTIPDPYEDGGTSISGGGGGSFDDSTDVIQIPEYDPVDLVYRSYANRGFVQSYVVTLNEIAALHTYLWGSSISDTLKKMFADPIQCILSLNLLPFEITSETVSNMIIGTVDTEISTHRLEKQFITIDCGYIDVTEFWKSYLDFSPYTKASIYLPFVGTREIDIDKIMGRRIGVKYIVDVVSGSTVIYVVDMSGYNNGVFPEDSMVGVLYQYIGNVALQIPISSASYGEFYASLISGLVTAGASAAAIYSGGMSAPLGVAALSGAALNVANSKPKITASGAMPAVSGWMGIQKPYLTIERPRQCLPEDQNTLTGYPAYITVTIGDVEGYNEFEIMHLENIPATEQEQKEIEMLLKSGVIL